MLVFEIQISAIQNTKAFMVSAITTATGCAMRDRIMYSACEREMRVCVGISKEPVDGGEGQQMGPQLGGQPLAGLGGPFEHLA